MNRLKQILYDFLSSNLRGSLAYEEVRKATLINLFSLCCIFYLLFYSHRMYQLGNKMLSYIYIYCALVIVLMQVYLRLRKRIVTVSHVLVIGLFSLEIFFLVRNGSTDLHLKSYYVFPGIYWYYIFPPFSVFLLGRKTGMIYNLILITATIIFFTSNYFENELYDNEFIVRFLSIYSAIFIFSLFFESIRLATFKAYEATHNKNVKFLKLISLKNAYLKKNNRDLSNLTEETKTQMEYLKVLNTELQAQNKRIAVQNRLLEEQRKEILKQHELLVQHKQSIDDSILYASYIQNALLPGDEMLKEFFPENFILYKPKNIIGGDFYFTKKIEDDIIIAAADGTGHGVPGALLSMLGIASLSEIVHRNDIHSTSRIITEMKREISSVLSRKDSVYDAGDSIDISLCKINLKSLELQFSGVNSPAYVVRGCDLTQLVADKTLFNTPTEEKPMFSHQNFQLQKGDCLYLFSDGFQDQIGGATKKKFMMRHFSELLVKIAPENMKIQKKILLQTFAKWKGENEQTDDVMVLGIKI